MQAGAVGNNGTANEDYAPPSPSTAPRRDQFAQMEKKSVGFIEEKKAEPLH
jgi:hypothetical protein